MTVREILHVVLRRWYTTVAALLLAALLTALFLQGSGVYSTRAVVEFRWPGAARIEADSGFENDSVISFADMVATRVNDGHEPFRYSQDEAPLYGAGIRDAAVVDLSFTGNQWVTDHPVAAITVSVVGRSEEQVRARQVALTDEVLKTADALQEEVSVSRPEYVVHALQPLSARIEHITPSRSSQITAFAAMLAAGVMGGVGAALMWERATLARMARRAGRAGRVAEGAIA
ncbi:hypothetical protein [Microbacterium sp. KHB019]|uniref:hypothetical protein n=1 Tax=Microbacterium sp. KHB019 TaxID=3129770 RepID=UPI00307A101D